MCTKEELNEKVYAPLKELKNSFYNAKSQQEWDTYKQQFQQLMETAKGLMTDDFFKKYKETNVQAIAKIYDYKTKQFNKQVNKKQFQPKVTYLLQPELAEALTAYIKLKTIQLSMEMEAQKSILDEKKFMN